MRAYRFTQSRRPRAPAIGEYRFLPIFGETSTLAEGERRLAGLIQRHGHNLAGRTGENLQHALAVHAELVDEHARIQRALARRAPYAGPDGASKNS